MKKITIHCLGIAFSVSFLIGCATSNPVREKPTEIKTVSFRPRDAPPESENGNNVGEEEGSAPVSSISLLKMSAELGDAGAQNNLGYSYWAGEGVTQDYEKAVAWYRKAAAQGVALASYNLGVVHSKGQGVPQSNAKAFSWYKKAAEQGSAMAQNAIAEMYYQGEGVPRDRKQSAVWRRRAAEQGFPNAQYNLGVNYSEGDGVPEDHKKALEWFTKAAQQGDVGAQNNLKVMYHEGKGTPRDDIEAYVWLKLENDQTPGIMSQRSQLTLDSADLEKAEHIYQGRKKAIDLRQKEAAARQSERY